MIQCQGCTCAGWLWEGEGGLGDHQPGVYVPLKALFLVSERFCSTFNRFSSAIKIHIIIKDADIILSLTEVLCIVAI